MQLDPKLVVKDLENQAMTQPGTDGVDRPVTYRDLASTALLTTEASEELGREEKYRCYSISQKLYANRRKIQLTVDEAALIKDRGAKFLSVLAYGRLCDWLEGEVEARDAESLNGSSPEPDPDIEPAKS